MHGTWVLALGVICLLQCSVSGEPRPDFALGVSLYGTARVTGAISDTQSLVTDINANLYITLKSNFPGLSNLLQLTQEVGSTVVELLDDVLSPLASLAPSSSSEDVIQFDTVLSAIGSMNSFLNGRLNQINSALGGIVRSGSLPSLFADALGRAGAGLRELTNALAALKSAVTALLAQSSGESDECPPKPIRAKLVYRVVYAVRTLRAYLPVVTYTLTTTVENIAIADNFVDRLTDAAEDVQEPTQYVNVVLASTGTVNTAVSDAIGTVVTRYNTVHGEVSALGNLGSLMAYGGVEEILNAFNTTLQLRNVFGSQFSAALADISEQLRLVLVPDEDTPTVNNSEVVATLVRVLIANGPYARFCFYKFAELVFGLTNAGMLGVERCVNRELLRLQQLRTVLLAHVSLLLFDLEDITAELRVCNATPNAGSAESCVAMVVGYYNHVATSFHLKFQNLFVTGVAEAVASKNRLLACVRVLQYEIVDGSALSLKNQIMQCAQNGPYV